MSNVKFPKIHMPSKKDKQTAQLAARTYMVLSMAVLIDTFGFGAKRLKRFSDRFLQLSYKISSGEDTVEGMLRKMQDIYNVDTRRWSE